MAPHDPGSTVCEDLARLALSVGRGRLGHRGMLAISLRAALLLDLAAYGAIDAPQARDGVALDAGGFARGTLQIDVTPLGWRPADQLLGFVRRHPDRSMDHVLRRGRPHLAAVSRQLVRDGQWVVRRRVSGQWYDDVAAEHYAAVRRRISDLCFGRATPTGEHEAALAAIADVLGLCHDRDVDEPASPLLLERLGGIGWLGRDLVEYLRTMRIQRELSATPFAGGDG